MALTEFDINLTIGSSIGFRQVGGGAENGAIIGPFPTIQTIRDLEGNVYTYGDAQRAILEVEPLDPFYLYPYSDSPVQTITMNNIGNIPLVITSASDITFSSESVTAILTATSFPITIPPLGSSTFGLSYRSTTPGNYVNFFIIKSNHYSRLYRVITEQIVGNTFSVRPIPTKVITTTTVLGLQYLTTIELVPVVNGVDNFDTVLTFNASLTGNQGWSFTTGTNSVNLTWDPDYVNNVNSATGYTATLEVSVLGIDNLTTVTNTAIVNIDYSRYANLSTWISPSAPNNSFIGISLDKFDGDKILTIGVGSGADGSPVYDEGGSVFVRMRNLGIGSASLDTPYPYWSTVYSIPLTATIQTYLSGEIGGDGLPLYVKKNTDGLNYADYFGFEQSIGSMFVVTYNGYDLVNIDINNLRELSGDTDFDLTMENITRAFHYYSEIDNLGRINNLPQYPFTLSTSTTPLPLGETRTRLFRGFVKTWRPFVNSTGTNVIGSGSGAAFDVTTNDPGYSVSLHPGSVGTGYNNNDTIKILGSALGGVTPTNDLLITVTASSGSVTGIVTATGFSASWIVDTSIVPLPA